MGKSGEARGRFPRFWFFLGVPWVLMVGLALLGGVVALQVLVEFPDGSGERVPGTSAAGLGGAREIRGHGRAFPTPSPERPVLYSNDVLSIRVAPPDGWTVTEPEQARELGLDYVGTLFLARTKEGTQVTAVRERAVAGKRSPSAYLSESSVEELTVGRFPAAKARRLYTHTGIIQYAVLRDRDVIIVSAYLPPGEFADGDRRIEALVGSMSF